MKKIHISVLTALFLSFSMAQHTGDGRPIPHIGVLEGAVFDTISQKPIEYVSVSVVNLRTGAITTGGLTDKTGHFFIEEIPLGRYNLVFEFIGFTPKTFGPIMLSPREGNIKQNVGDIYLVSTSLELNQIEVEGDRPMFTQTVEKKIFNVEQNTLSTGGSALDVLRQVPGVDVDIDGTISVRGNSNVNILLDGKPSSMTSGDSEMFLENIPAGNIRDVELLTNPSAKYDPEGMAGIINIVLKENKFAGLNGNVRSGISTNKGYNASGQINFRNEKMNIYVNSGYRNDVRGAGGNNYRETYIADTTIIDQVIDGNRGGTSILLKSGLEYQINRNTSAGFAAIYNQRLHSHDRRMDTVLEDSIITKYYRTSLDTSTRSNSEVNVSFDHNFDSAKHRLSLLASASTGTRKGNESQHSYPAAGYETLVDPSPEQSNDKRLDKELYLKADYVRPFGTDGKIEMGYSGEINSDDTDYETFEYSSGDNSFALDSNRSNHFIFEENIQSAYGQFTNQFGKIGLQAGLRIEHATNLSKLMDTDEKFENPYTSYFPSASVTFGPPKLFQIQTSYSKRVRRPSTRHLNPSVRQFDETSMRVGNPFLKPEYIDVSELNFSVYKNGLSLSLGVYYRNVTDRISHYKYVTEEGVTVVTYENYDHTKSYGSEVIISGSLQRKLRLMISGNLYTDETKASGLTDEDIVYTSTGLNARINTTYVLSPSTEIMVMAFYRSPRSLPFGEMKSMSFSSISIKQKFARERFSVSLRMHDIFNTMGFGYTTYDDFYYQKSSRKFDSQVVSLNLEYRFGKMEDKSRFSRENGRSSDGGEGDFELE